MDKMMDKNKALRKALKTLESERDKCLDCGDKDGTPDDVYEAITAINQALSASVQSAERGEPVAWEDGLKNLVVRSDMRDRLNYKGPWIGMGRSIPDSWVPILYTTPPAAPKEKP